MVASTGAFPYDASRWAISAKTMARPRRLKQAAKLFKIQVRSWCDPMSELVLTVEAREGAGKGAARAVRRGGKIPGVIYGGAAGSISVALARKEVIKALHTGKLLSHMIEIDQAGKRQTVIPRAVQFDPVTDEPLHIDLYRVDENTRIDVEVVVHFVNSENSPGLKRGGVLNIVRHTVEVNCLAKAIPEELVADLTGLGIGDAVHISNIPLPQGVRPTIRDRDFTIATITGRMADMVEIEAPEAAPAEGEAEAESE